MNLGQVVQRRGLAGQVAHLPVQSHHLAGVLQCGAMVSGVPVDEPEVAQRFGLARKVAQVTIDLQRPLRGTARSGVTAQIGAGTGTAQ